MTPKSRIAKDASDAGPLSTGGWIIVALALLSTVVVLAWPTPTRTGMEMWTSARNHADMYRPLISDWNRATDQPVNLFLLSDIALKRRMMSAFLSDTPVADLIEVEKNIAGQTFAGPLEDVGFVDLTDRLHASGLYDQLNEPSFGPWTSRGRVFGLPHDVHPVMLAYRADLVEAAGIDMSQILTWDDFARVLKPLIKDLDGDGLPDRYLLNVWHTSMDQIEVLLLQAGGGFFDGNDHVAIDTDINAKVLATVASWVAGPNRIAADAPEFTASGNQLRLQGFVIASIVPDWLCGLWKSDMPGLGGKLKFMPLPAWERGGRRTSVWGGTMLGIPKTARDPEAAWAFAKHLYLSPQLAENLYKSTGIITPVKSLWPSPFYDAPDPFFCNQSPGRMYINLAPEVPRRPSSPFNSLAKARVQDAMVGLHQYAVANNVYDPQALLPEAHRQLRHAQEQVQAHIDRNVFLKEAKP